MKPSHLIIFDNSYLISSSQKIKTGSLGWLLKKKYFQSNVFLWHILNRFVGKIYSALMLNIQRRSLYLLLLTLFYQFKVKKNFLLSAHCSLYFPLVTTLWEITSHIFTNYQNKISEKSILIFQIFCLSNWWKYLEFVKLYCPSENIESTNCLDFSVVRNVVFSQILASVTLEEVHE